jgi:hypothetical protein
MEDIDEVSNNSLNEELESLKNTETSLWKLFMTLLSPKTMPHIVLISVMCIILHILASSDSLTNLTSVTFLGLSAGYTITALGSRNERIRKWTIAESKDLEISQSKALNIVKKFKICIFPLSMSLAAIIVIMLLFGKNGLIPQVYDFIPIFLGSLFVLWAIIQGISFSSWASSISAKMSNQKSRISNLKISSIFIGTILFTVSIILVGAFQFIKDPSSSIFDIIIENWIFLSLIIITYVSTTIWTWKIKTSASKNPSLNSFSNRWTLICHLFLSWHILTIWRQNFMSPNTIEIFIEELVLMIFTVFMAIWSLTSKGYTTKFKLLDEENSLPWGLAFGYAYAGSVAMLTNVFDEITTVMTIGHLVVILTVVYVYRKILINVISQHDEGIIVRRIVDRTNLDSNSGQEDILEVADTDLEESATLNSETDDENWQEDNDVDWDKESEDNTISSDVEWDELIEVD